MAHETLTFSTSTLFSSSLRYIEKRLEPFKKNSAIKTKIITSNGRSNLIVDFNGFNEGMTTREGFRQLAVTRGIASSLIDAVADVMITDYKNHYIKTSIKLPIEDEISRHAFICALSNFDRTTDKIIAKSLIKLTPNFLLDSFYAFSIDMLKNRWQEVCALANENACFLVCDGTFHDLLRFLISNSESKEPEVHLFKNEGKWDVLTGGLKPINVYVNDELPEDVRVVSALVSTAPKKIFLHQDASESPIVDFIQNLFGNCVQVVQN